MKDSTRRILIQSILGGHSPSSYLGREDQFFNSLGIDPAQPLSDSSTSDKYYLASGFLRPTSGIKTSGSIMNNSPMWMINEPKKNATYVYDSGGSVYSMAGTGLGLAGLGDLTDGGTASGNGAAYYDNYIYFSRDTTIARYGPLDGTPSFTDDYWVSTLGKTALSNTTYPVDFLIGLQYPNHVLHRHSDGKLYIADVVGNQGVLHVISTSKTTVEGDTDNGSTYNKISVGYGLWPTAIESYGSNLVIAFSEGVRPGGSNGLSRSAPAKIAFWDTSSQNINQITWVEFADPLVTSLKNINGVLYATSGNSGANGFRVSRYVGGYTFEEVFLSESGEAPFGGAVDGNSNRLLFGSFSIASNISGVINDKRTGCVYSLGLQKSSLGQGIFNVMGATKTAATVTALSLTLLNDFVSNAPTIGWSTGASGSSENGIDIQDASTYGTVQNFFWSKKFVVGQPFKIKKIRFPLAQAVAANMTITPKIYTDDGVGTTYSLTPINNTNDSGLFNIIRKSGSTSEVLTAKHNFWLELVWSGSALCIVGLPITIEYELLDD